MLGFGYGRLILSGTVLATTALGLFGLANSSLGAALVGETRRVDLGQKAQAGESLQKAADELNKMMAEMGDAQSILQSLEALHHQSTADK